MDGFGCASGGGSHSNCKLASLFGWGWGFGLTWLQSWHIGLVYHSEHGRVKKDESGFCLRAEWWCRKIGGGKAE